MRYERKYRIEGLSRAFLVQQILQHPAGFRLLHPDRQINNIYFDTPNFTAYWDNVMGLSERKKFRARWYGFVPQEIHNPKLEVKIRQNELGSKDTYSLSPFGLEDLAPLTAEVNARCGQQAGYLQPVLLSAYHRAYYSTADGRFRLTLDSDLQYTGLLYHRRFYGQHQHREEGVHIVELKYDAVWDDWAEQVLQGWPFRRTKNSKYVSGLSLCW